MSNVYEGSWQYRWYGTPHMKNSLSKNRKESILAHQLACIGFWFNLRRISPNLDRLVDSEKVYEILWGHDLGEVFIGDISQARQTKGEGAGKSKVEREEIIKMSKGTPEKIVQDLLRNFDSFESKHEKTNNIEILVCKLIDNIQGNHFAIVFGNDFGINSDLISKIVNRSFIKAAIRLLEFLKNTKNKGAYKEARLIIDHHISAVKNSGVKLKVDSLPSWL